ncbi:cytochrome P450, family 2, subfamily U [Pseudohyphozyma bogoriensis]|nr:cytochrome P450, family 2, subfamily U [Pseudohyphozyma bogoriensis]
MSSPSLSSSPSTLAAVGVVLVLAYLAAQYRNRKSRGPLPPGPKGIPIFGNLFQVPKSRPWVKMEEWTREFGPIYTLKMGLKTVIVLGRAPAALELLDKRSAIYSSRPRFVMTSEHVSRGLRMTFMPHGDLWRSERKLLHQLTSPAASASYEGIQDQESAQLVRDMLKNPKGYWGHAQRYAGSTILQVAFAKRAKSPQDHAITEMRRVNDMMTRTAVAGRYMVDSLPFLNYLPPFLAPWKREASRIFVDTLALFSHYVGEVKDKMKEGTDVHCFASSILKLQDSYGLKDEEAVFLAGAMYGAGSDTTSDAISTFLLAMVAHPHVLAKAQEELERVVGRARFPDFNDQSELVYCNAVIQETMRWRTVIAGGLAHCTTEDDVYQGYFIPKGSTIIPNHWAIHLDPEVYPDPHSFKPERFVKDGKLIGTPYAAQGHHGFGFGRRICPGMHIANRSLYIVFTRLMWAADLCHAVDPATGNVIPVNVDSYSEGFSSHPVGLKLDIKSRGPWVDEVVELAAVEHDL